jgi:rhodanese-related sulfurtransferase
MTIKNLAAADVVTGLKEDTIVLIDVREPAKYATRIRGALLFPLSTFDPDALPDCGNRSVAFPCGSGIRAAKAVAACVDAGLPYDSRFKDGIQAWKAAGLPTVTVDPATGQTHDQQ